MERWSSASWPPAATRRSFESGMWRDARVLGTKLRTTSGVEVCCARCVALSAGDSVEGRGDARMRDLRCRAP